MENLTKFPSNWKCSTVEPQEHKIVCLIIGLNSSKTPAFYIVCILVSHVWRWRMECSAKMYVLLLKPNFVFSKTKNVQASLYFVC